MDESISRVHQGKGRTPVKKRIDPKEVRSVEAEKAEGRDRDANYVWQQVMEYHGFRWFAPQRMNQVFGPEVYIPKIVADVGAVVHTVRPHEEGMWRREAKPRMSFRVSDLVSLFPQGPASFDEWMRGEKMKAEAERRGIALSSKDRNRLIRQQRDGGAGRIVVVAR